MLMRVIYVLVCIIWILAEASNSSGLTTSVLGKMFTDGTRSNFFEPPHWY